MQEWIIAINGDGFVQSVFEGACTYTTDSTHAARFQKTKLSEALAYVLAELPCATVTLIPQRD